jgi:hypothetical protein
MATASRPHLALDNSSDGAGLDDTQERFPDRVIDKQQATPDGFRALSRTQTGRAFLHNLKPFRAIATRCDKLARTFPGAVHLVAAFHTSELTMRPQALALRLRAQALSSTGWDALSRTPRDAVLHDLGLAVRGHKFPCATSGVFSMSCRPALGLTLSFVIPDAVQSCRRLHLCFWISFPLLRSARDDESLR